MNIKILLKNSNYPRIGRIKYLAEHKLASDKIFTNKLLIGLMAMNH